MDFEIKKEKDGILIKSSSDYARLEQIAGNLVLTDDSREDLAKLKKNASGDMSPKKLAKLATEYLDNAYIVGTSFKILTAYQVNEHGSAKLDLKNYESKIFSRETINEFQKELPLMLGVATSSGVKTLKRRGEHSNLGMRVYSLITHPNSLEDKTAKIFKQYVGLGDSKIDELEFKWNIGRLEKKINKAPAVHTNKQTIDERLEHYESNQTTKELILDIVAPEGILDVNEFRQEILSHMTKAFSLEGIAFKHTGYLALTCDANESKKLLEILSQKSDGIFSESRLTNALISTREAYTVFIPEMYGHLPIIEGSLKQVEAYTQWNLQQINAHIANKRTTGSGAKVAIIDTGVDYNHIEFKNNFQSYKGWNYIDNNENPMDDNQHGTHVGGTVAGMRTGVAPGSTLLAYKVLNALGFGSEVNVVAAIEQSIDDNADVINMSLGSQNYSQFKEEACKAAANAGIIVVAAAGNSGRGYSYPAACSGVIATAAVDARNYHAGFSNISDATDISAPGVNIPSALPGNAYGLLTGTSMASPHMAGVAALAKSINPNIDYRSFERILEDSSLELGRKESEQREKYGAGLVQADEVVAKSMVMKKTG